MDEVSMCSRTSYKGDIYVEIGILLHTLIVPLTAICSNIITIKIPTRDPISQSLHARRQCAIGAVVVAVRSKVVIARQRGVGLELVVAIETRLTVQKRECSSARRRVATDAQSERGDVAFGFDTQYSGEDGEVVSDVVDVLLGVDELL
jgi:hypothetical protein